MGSSSFTRITGVFLLLAGGLANAQSSITPHPYASIATEGEDYVGPARAVAYDLTGTVIRIGLLAPLSGSRKPEGEAMVAAARMALQDSAPRGIVDGRRVTLSIEDSSSPSWGVVSDAVIRLVLNEEVIALITSTSGADAHLSEQVGNRVGVPVLTLSTDATTTQIDIPWIFRIGGSDATEAQLIAHDIYAVRHLRHILVVTQHGHDGNRGRDAMLHAAADLGAPAPSVFALDEDRSGLGPLMKRIGAESPQAIVLWMSGAVAAQIVTAIHTAEVNVLSYLSDDASNDGRTPPAMDRPGEEVWTISEGAPGSVQYERFTKRYEQLTGLPPTTVAARTYDAVTVTVHSLQAAGPNRARVRDQLARVQAFPGMSGAISFDREGNDQVTPHLVRQR